MYAIVGASGNTGGVIAEKLLASGKKVRAIGRNAGHLEHLTSRGAEAFIANVTDAAALIKAFDGASAVYAMIPPNASSSDVPAYQRQVSDVLTAAIAGASVPKAVVLSSVGGDKPEKTGPVTGLYHLEQKLNGLDGLNAVYLRAGYFMENLLAQAGAIRNFGILAGPLRPDLKLPFIAARDIGAAAAELLLNLDFTGKQARELLGPRDVNYDEAASIVGKAIGKPGLSYMQLSGFQLRPALLQLGMSKSMIGLLLEMAESLNNGHMKPLEPRSASNTTPTSLEDFAAQVFAPRFRAA